VGGRTVIAARCARWTNGLGDSCLLSCEWRCAVEAAEIEGLTAGRKGGGVVLYNLPHSCLTNLAAAGVPDTTARAISGHKTDSARRRYVITQETAKVAALTAMSDAVPRRFR